MTEGQETELKLVASPAMLLHLRDHPMLTGKDSTLTLVTRYFDTPDGALHRGEASLRLREAGRRSEQTFKSKAKGNCSLRRGEWNAPVTGAAPDPAAFPAEARKLLQALLGGAQPQPLAITRIERTTRRLRFHGSTIEAAFDFGTVEAHNRSEPASELELELIEGEPADLFALARELPLGPELAWSVASKAERGHAIALDLPFSAVRTSAVAVSGEMDVRQGFQAIAWNCLAQLLGNYREVIASGDPDAVHQSRVAIRRLRAAFSLFGHAVADEQTPIFRAEWKAAASGLGPARDLHVLIERVRSAVADGGEDAGDLLRHLDTRLTAATREAQALLAGTAFQHLLIRFAEWLERDMPRAEQPLVELVAAAFDRRWRKLAHGKPLDRLGDEALHVARIRGKKLRYATEFFAALYSGAERERRAFAKALARLQDKLGTVQDLAAAHKQRAHLFTDLDRITAARFDAQLNELVDSHGPARKRLIRSAMKALDRLARAPAWWMAPAQPESKPTETPAAKTPAD